MSKPTCRFPSTRLVHLGVMLLGLLLPGSAAAADVLVMVEENRMPVPGVFGGGQTPSAVDPLWYLLLTRRDARVDVRAGTWSEGCALLPETGATTLLSLRIRWKRWVQDGLPRLPVPAVGVEVRTLKDGRCRRIHRHASTRRPRAFISKSPGSYNGLVYSADRELHEALSDALWRSPYAGRVPIGRSSLPEAELRIPVRLLGDSKYRERYGEGWQDKAARRVHLANHVLGGTGIGLEVVGHGEWETPWASTDPQEILTSLDGQRKAWPGELVIGFTAHAGLEFKAFEDHIAGMATRGGLDGVMVADSAIFRGDDPAWDEAREAFVLSHELFHHLGVGHAPEPGFLMSPYASMTRRVREDFAFQARASAEHRYGDGPATLRLETYLRRGLPTDYVASELIWAGNNIDPAHLRAGCLGPYSNLAYARSFQQRVEHDPYNGRLILLTGASATAAATHPDTREQAQRILDPDSPFGVRLDAALAELGEDRSFLSSPQYTSSEGCPVPPDALR